MDKISAQVFSAEEELTTISKSILAHLKIAAQHLHHDMGDILILVIDDLLYEDELVQALAIITKR